MKKLNNKGFAISTVIYGTFILFIMILAILLASINSSLRLLEDRVNAVSDLPEIKPSDAVQCNVEKLEKPIIDETGLVPVIYDEIERKWKVTTQEDPDWYDYCNQKWANAVSIKSGVITTETPEPYLNIPDGKTITEDNSDVYAMFVWIPRFEYTIGCTEVEGNKECLGYKINGGLNLRKTKPIIPGAIDIKFVSKNDNVVEFTSTIAKYDYDLLETRTPSNWYTHPAFDFGGEKLSGIWVGKFETTGSETEPTILPNLRSIANVNLSKKFAISTKFTESDNIYKLNGDAHILKNSDWGAVAYLSQSIYGKYGNPLYEGFYKQIYINNYTKTGISSGEPSASSASIETCYYDDIEDRDNGIGFCGGGASTTGNIYGIYDMNGGTEESVMANYGNTPSSSGFDSSWFDSNSKYYNVIPSLNLMISENINTVGGALGETENWYSDNVVTMNTSDAKWLTRGNGYNNASNSGIFSVDKNNGTSIGSFRVVFVPNQP